MRQSLIPVLASVLLTLASCQKEVFTPAEYGLEGVWQLSHRQCFCASAPLPNERVVFAANRFAFYKDNQLGQQGEFLITTAASSCFPSGATAPALRFTFPPTRMADREVQYRLDGNTLTLDYGGPCDAPVDTYVRLQ